MKVPCTNVPTNCVPCTPPCTTELKGAITAEKPFCKSCCWPEQLVSNRDNKDSSGRSRRTGMEEEEGIAAMVTTEDHDTFHSQILTLWGSRRQN